MLVLSRKKGEKVIIGEGATQITITVVEIRGDKVRYGIDCDRSIPVHREEVYNEIHHGYKDPPPRTPPDSQ